MNTLETKDSVTIKREKEARQSSLKSKLGWGGQKERLVYMEKWKVPLPLSINAEVPEIGE